MTARVVITGARGFLGGALARSLRAAGRDVLALSRTAGEAVDVAAPLDAIAAQLRAGDVVINAAGVPIKDAASDVALIRDNLAIARDVARACVQTGARLLHVSSADIWPVHARAGAVESDEPLPDSAYGLSKLAAERELTAARAKGGLRHLVVRPSYIYGAGMFAGRVFGGVVRQARAGNEVVLRGDPESATDYVHSDDVAHAIALLLLDANMPWDGRAFHVASGALTTLSTLAHTLARHVNADALVRFEAPAPTPTVRQQGVVSTSALRALGWAPRVSFDEGCARYAKEAA